MKSDNRTLEIRSLEKYYSHGEQKIAALDGVSLAVDKGDFVAIMGASGSGKSTLLHLIGGLTNADRGEIIINGTDISGYGDHDLTLFRRNHLGFVFQAYNLMPFLTAEENIKLPLLGKKVTDSQLEKLLDRLGLKYRRHHRPDALSGGEQQRVAIARALITEPDVLLVDEPTGNLDSVAEEDICQLLRQLCDEQQCTIAMVTHEPAVAFAADRVHVLSDGKIVDSFATSECDNEAELAVKYQQIVHQQKQLTKTR